MTTTNKHGLIAQVWMMYDLLEREGELCDITTGTVKELRSYLAKLKTHALACGIDKQEMQDALRYAPTDPFRLSVIEEQENT